MILPQLDARTCRRETEAEHAHVPPPGDLRVGRHETSVHVRRLGTSALKCGADGGTEVEEGVREGGGDAGKAGAVGDSEGSAGIGRRW
jgi:hypothetical protein